MQLKRSSIGAALGALTANLLAATAAHAQTADTSVYQPDVNNDASDSDASGGGTDIGSGLARIDSAILFYQENGGRVRAVEPTSNVTLNASDGRVVSFRFTADTLTGATPNGAMPWNQNQTFTTPAHAPGTTTTVTSASGKAQLVTIPGTGTVVRQYTVPANQLPLDAFKDQRYAYDLGYSAPFGDGGRYSIGGSYSTEHDYTSYSVNGGVSQDFNHHNTTLSLALNYEADQSSPIFGTPSPLTQMSGDTKGPSRSKTVVNVVLGLTQAISRHWLTELNYSYGETSGYQTDPYRVISLVDGTTGAPVEYLYESRPSSRTRQSVFWDNRLALLSTFADISLRSYSDSWGIKSLTAEISDRIPLFGHFYIQPGVRYYHQTAADFYRHYLVSGNALPTYASSDGRLSNFNAQTNSLQLGLDFGHSEIYMRFENYSQHGQTHPAGAPGALAGENLSDAVSANSVMIGFSFAFR